MTSWWNSRPISEQLIPPLYFCRRPIGKVKVKATFTAYNSFVLNRPDQSWGGVAILVRKGIHTRNIQIPPMETLEERGIAIRVRTGKWVNIISVYCPDGANFSSNEMRSLFEMVGEHGIIGGDFNGHSRVWESNHACNQSGNVLVDIIDNNENIPLTTKRILAPARAAQQPLRPQST